MENSAPDPYQHPLEWLAYHTRQFGPPVDLNDADYEAYLNQLREGFAANSGADAPFYMVLNVCSFQLEFLLGIQQALGYPDNLTLEGFFGLIHPDYLEPYQKWATAAYQVAFEKREQVIPLRQSYRVTIPLRHRNGQYFWYSQHATAIRIDADKNIICQLNTYYYEGAWNKYNLRPFEACLARDNSQWTSWENRLHSLVGTFYYLDQFRNSEIELLHLYIAGHQTVADIMQVRKGWSRHVIYEYNKNILKKAQRLTQFDFREAKDVALYLCEKGYL